MSALQVKDFPRDLYEELGVCAETQDRSLSQQTMHILREYLHAYRQLGNHIGWKVLPVDRLDCGAWRAAVYGRGGAGLAH